MKFAVFLAVVAVAAAAPTAFEYESLWTQFKADFGKNYLTAAEHDGRFSVFKDNVDFINAHNLRADEHGYSVGINQFADMNSAEFKQTMLTYKAENKKAGNVVVLDETNLAASVDWVSKGAVTPVKNQGQCGSCWAFSTTGSVEGAFQIATGQLKSFSEQELVDCAGSYGNQGCNGGLMDDGFKYIEAKGDALESTYAYTGKTGTCSSSKSGQAAIAKGQLTTFSDVTTDSEAQLMAAVNKGPVSVAIEADQSGFQFYKSGVFSGTCGSNLDHGVLVVGYGTDSGSDYWKVKNSWGTTWGQAGYIMMAKGSASSNSTSRKLLGGGGGGGASGECGILKQPSYPTVSASVTEKLTVEFKPELLAVANATSHYEDPKPNGCQSDEQSIQIQGVQGDFCTPKCTGILKTKCPTDVPSGVTAKPQCALQDTSGNKYCALICSPSTDEKSLRAGDAQCGSATCKAIQGVGLCTYDD
jgi:C1A family cysteine protease